MLHDFFQETDHKCIYTISVALFNSLSLKWNHVSKHVNHLTDCPKSVRDF